MTNAHASKQHGLVGRFNPKSKERKRRNKAKGKVRKADQEEKKMASRKERGIEL
ncbi:MAG: hypothetical protein AAB373_02140 [Patescibacteria group bacterium]